MYTPLDIKRNDKYGSNYWEVFSNKASRIIRCFSDLEYENYILVETDPNIISFCEQPIKIRYLLDGDEIHSIIDMWVKYKDKTEKFIEIKYLSELNPINPKSIRSIKQTKAQKLWCNENGFVYEIRTENDIRGNSIFLSNMKTVLSYIKRSTQQIETDLFYIKKAITKSRITIKKIHELLSEIPLERIKESISWMIYLGIVSANVKDVEFGIQTEVWLNAE